MTEYSAFGPTIGAALNATLFSYNGSCCVGVTVDTTAVPDHELLLECLEEGFAEVIARSRPPARRAYRRPRGAHSVPKTLASS